MKGGLAEDDEIEDCWKEERLIERIWVGVKIYLAYLSKIGLISYN